MNMCPFGRPSRPHDLSRSTSSAARVLQRSLAFPGLPSLGMVPCGRSHRPFYLRLPHAPPFCHHNLRGKASATARLRMPGDASPIRTLTKRAQLRPTEPSHQKLFCSLPAQPDDDMLMTPARPEVLHTPADLNSEAMRRGLARSCSEHAEHAPRPARPPATPAQPASWPVRLGDRTHGWKETPPITMRAASCSP